MPSAKCCSDTDFSAHPRRYASAQGSFVVGLWEKNCWSCWLLNWEISIFAIYHHPMISIIMIDKKKHQSHGYTNGRRSKKWLWKMLQRNAGLSKIEAGWSRCVCSQMVYRLKVVGFPRKHSMFGDLGDTHRIQVARQVHISHLGGSWRQCWAKSGSDETSKLDGFSLTLTIGYPMIDPCPHQLGHYSFG